MSYGSGWGSSPWGGSAQPSEEATGVVVDDTPVMVQDSVAISVPLRVIQAYAPDSFSVIITFSNDLDISYPPLIDPSNYTIAGLTVTGATVINNSQVQITTSEQVFILYTVFVGQALSVNGDPLGPANKANFFGTLTVPTFFVGAQSSTKVEVVFSVAMQVNSEFLDPANYSITWNIGGAPVTVLSVTPSGDDPIRRATLELGTALHSKEYYALVISPTVESVAGLSVEPDTDVFQWADMTDATRGHSIEVKIKDFSGEVTGGLLGTPAGQVFFSPALESAVSSDSTIELEELSVCTRAYDTYTFPVIPDPQPLFTFGPNVHTVIGPTSVLWATPERLGLPRFNVADRRTDTLPPLSDSPAVGTLSETIDTTKASFLNDTRWKTFPGTIVFKTADNLTPIGPGPTQVVSLDWPKIELLDNIPTRDDVTVVSGP